MRKLYIALLAPVAAATVALAGCSSSPSPTPTSGPTVSHTPASQAESAFNDVPDKLEQAIPQATFKTNVYSPGLFSGIVTYKSAPNFEGGYEAKLEQSAPAGRWNDLTKVATRRFKVKGLDGVIYDPTHSSHPNAYVHRSVGGKEYVASLQLDWPKNLTGHDDALMKGAGVLATALQGIK